MDWNAMTVNEKNSFSS